MEILSNLHVGPKFDRERYEHLEAVNNCHPHAHLSFPGQVDQGRRIQPKIKVFLNKTKNAVLRITRRHETASDGVPGRFNETNRKTSVETEKHARNVNSAAHQPPSCEDLSILPDHVTRIRLLIAAKLGADDFLTFSDKEESSEVEQQEASQDAISMRAEASKGAKGSTRENPNLILRKARGWKTTSALSTSSGDVIETQNTQDEEILNSGVEQETCERSVPETRTLSLTHLLDTEGSGRLFQDSEVRRFKHMLPCQETPPLIAKGHVSRLRVIIAQKLGVTDSFPSAQVLSFSDVLEGEVDRQGTEADLPPPALCSPLVQNLSRGSSGIEKGEYTLQNSRAGLVCSDKASEEAPNSDRGVMGSASQEVSLNPLSKNSFQTASELLEHDLDLSSEEEEIIFEGSEIRTTRGNSQQVDRDGTNDDVAIRKNFFELVFDKVRGFLHRE